MKSSCPISHKWKRTGSPIKVSNGDVVQKFLCKRCNKSKYISMPKAS
jgi:hypothetical protein